MKFFSGMKARKLSKAIESYPTIFKNYRDLIDLHLADKEYKDAEECIALAQKQIWSKEENAWLNLQSLRLQIRHPGSSAGYAGTALSVLEDLDAGTQLRLEVALIAAPCILDGRFNLSTDELNRFISNISSLAQSVSGQESSIPLLQTLAEIEAANGNIAEAAKHMEAVIKSVTETRYRPAGKLFLRSAEIAQLAGESTEKIKSLWIRAIESGDLSDAETVIALIGIASIHLDENNLLGAMERYETALRFSGHNQDSATASVRFRLAKIYFELGRIPQAEKEAGIAAAGGALAGDRLAEVFLWLSSLKSKQDQLKPAEELLGKALAAAETPEMKILILRDSATIQGKRGAYSQAISALDSALSLNPDNPDPSLLFMQAQLYNLEGSFHKSLKILKHLSLEQTPGHPPVPKNCLLMETARTYLGQTKLIRALETMLEILESGEENQPEYLEAKKVLGSLKKSLQSTDEIKKYKLDGPDRKTLANLLSRIPEGEDFFARLRNGLRKTRSGLIGGIEKILRGRTGIDEAVLDEIEELMILSDLGVETTTMIIEGLREKLARKELHDAGVVREHIRAEIERILAGHSAQMAQNVDTRPWIIMVVGVNGVGKTTTIAKIARRYKEEGRSVLMAAGDTFRAGAIEQLREWGRRLDVEIVAHDEGADPSAVAWDAVAAAKSRDVDILIIDTAGRLHTKSNLMEELKKVQRVIAKNMSGAPHEVLLVLDATTGQNAIMQAREFCQTVDVSGLVLTKLDGTAKGGIIVSIVQDLNIPIKLIGIGERMDDLRNFDAEAFARALFDDTGDMMETNGKK